MSQWKKKLISFMYGRYGVDTLYYALNILWFLFLILQILTRSIIFGILAWVCLFFMVFRMLSRNIARRRAENDAFLRLWNPVKSFFKLQWTRVKDARTSVYRKCPQCKATLRLPRRRGTHTAVCPRCSNRFDVRIFF